MTPGSLSRRRFLATAGASAAGASLLAACGGSGGASSETTKFGDGDVGILNFLLTLEHLQAAFYADLVESTFLTAAARQALAKFGKEEEEHIALLTKTVKELGGEPAPKPQTKFALKTDSGALGLASTLENIGAAAYLGQLPNIGSDSVLSTLLTIHSVEGRHGAAMNRLQQKPVTPDGAFAKPATVTTVLKTVEPFIGAEEHRGATV